MRITVTAFDRSDRFIADAKAAPVEVLDALEEALNRLLQNSQAGSLRLHTLPGYPKPTIFKIDVTANHAWQLTFELDGAMAVLLRLGTHKVLNRSPR